MPFLGRYILSFNECSELKTCLGMSRRDRLDSFFMHKAVSNLFPYDYRNESRVLFANKTPGNPCVKLLILSETRPEKRKLGILETREIPEKFLGFEGYKFRVVVNPVKSVFTGEPNRRGPKIFLRDRPSIIEWFRKRQNKWGFETFSLDVSAIWTDRFFKNNGGEKAKKESVIIKADVSGILRVKDRDAFKKSFFAGLGHGKAFGCGMLELEPYTV